MRLAGQSAEEESVLRLADGCDPTALALSPAEGFLLSRIDGRTTRGVLRRIGGLAPGEVDRLIDRWLADGVLEPVRPGACQAARPAEPPPAAVEPKRGPGVALPELDATLE